MIVYASFRDIAQHPRFKGMHELELLHPNNDEAVKEVLWECGGDKHAPMAVQACIHRSNHDKKVAVGYRYVMHERGDEEWLNSGKASLECRIVKGKKTVFQKELMFLSGVGKRLSTDGSGQVLSSLRQNGYLMTKREREECAKSTAEIIALQKVQEVVRGKLSADEDVLWNLKSSSDVLEQDYLQLQTDYPE